MSKVDQLLDAAVARLDPLTERDEEFAARFGRWERPSFARRYRLEEMQRLIRWQAGVDGIMDLRTFVSALAPEDRRLAGEIARFVSERYQSCPATDKVLNTFRMDLMRRLELCGF